MENHPFVAMQQIDSSYASGSYAMLPGDIKGTYPFYHILDVGQSIHFPSNRFLQRVFLLVDGNIEIMDITNNSLLSERCSYIPNPENEIHIIAKEKSFIFEINWELSQEDVKQLEISPPSYPIIQLYSECPHYTEDFKSARTISRTIVPHNILPRFSMGSNESGENDRVEMNNHPAIDQYFYSFPDNDVILRIEESRIHFKGDTVLHVPLGAFHGVEIGENQKMHYVWIDFIVDQEAGLEYLNTVHKKL